MRETLGGAEPPGISLIVVREIEFGAMAIIAHASPIRVSMHSSPSRIVAVPCLRMAAFSDTISVDELHDHGGSCASRAPTSASSSAGSPL